MARATTPADRKLAADACNRRLSEERAKTAYEFCRSYNLSERILSEEDFVRSFRTDGRGSLDVRLDRDTAREDPIASRRVEFVFVPVERAKSAAR
jgi:outer membrane protein OmpA-like peptidoglycan-associated protein